MYVALPNTIASAPSSTSQLRVGHRVDGDDGDMRAPVPCTGGDGVGEHRRVAES